MEFCQVRHTRATLGSLCNCELDADRTASRSYWTYQFCACLSVIRWLIMALTIAFSMCGGGICAASKSVSKCKAHLAGNSVIGADSLISAVKQQLDDGEYETAIVALSKALPICADSARLYFYRSLAYLHMSSLDSSLADLNSSLRIAPLNVFATYNRGIVKARTGDTAGAIDDYTKAIKLDSSYARAFCNRAILYEHTGCYGAADSDFFRATVLAPDDALSLANWADLMLRTGRPDSAILLCRVALEIAPLLPLAHENLGTGFFMLGHLDSAQLALEHAIRLDSTRCDAFITLGEIVESKGQLDSATQCYRHAIGLIPGESVEEKANLLERIRRIIERRVN